MQRVEDTDTVVVTQGNNDNNPDSPTKLDLREPNEEVPLKPVNT